MGRRVFSREFKLEAVKLVRDRGVAVRHWMARRAQKGHLQPCRTQRISAPERSHGARPPAVVRWLPATQASVTACFDHS